MSSGTDIDELLDALQQMISMIRQFGNEAEAEMCDDWETRLYAWHDRVLAVTAAARLQHEGEGPVVINLTDSERAEFNDVVDLKAEVQKIGDAIFRAMGD